MTPLLRITYAIPLTMLCMATGFFNPVSAQEYEVRPTKINSKEADFSATYNGNDIIFCSARAKMDLSFDDDSMTLYYTDLFYSKMKLDGTYSNPEGLKGDVNTDYNEGHATVTHDGKRMYFTANLRKSLDNKVDRTSEYKLGIFYADFENGAWIQKGEFPYNSQNGKYSVAHPSLSVNDSVLYFCSNMSGGHGNSDIYRSIWRDGQWSEPENLGGKVNTKGNEFFPFINEYNILYFSTDYRNDSEGMDIYSSLEEDGEYQKPVRLSNSINTEFDEFAYQEKTGTNQGCFSSNRDDEQDDIFFFTKFNDNFNECLENYEPSFCYHFYDVELTELDTLPIRYEWHMGDGNIFTGKTVDHCFSNFGNYHVSLNVVDTITRVVFKKVSETEIVIAKTDRPFIFSSDTINQNQPFECKLELYDFDQFNIVKTQWQTDDGSTYSGDNLVHTFTEPGEHQIKCSISGPRKNNGLVPVVCVYKNIYCNSSDTTVTDVQVLACCDKQDFKKVKMKKKFMMQDKFDDSDLTVQHLVIAEFKEPVDRDHASFKNFHGDITEIKTDSFYYYTVAQANDWQQLLPEFDKLKNAGIEKMYATEFTEVELKTAHKLMRVDRSQENLVATTEVKTVSNEVTKTDDSVPVSTQPITQQETETKVINPEPQTTVSSGVPGMQSKILYRISLLKSTERIPFNDQKFKHVETEISELKRDGYYEYATLAVPKESDLQNMLKNLRAAGYSDAHTESFDLALLKNELLRKGRYIQMGDAKRLNVEFSRLDDIKFEYNSSSIKPESFKSLNYIAAMLMLEENFTLRISAHTCSIGSDRFNQKLSEERAQAVTDYFIQKGIDPKRLKPVGFGNAKPSQSNESEMGRAANRRVEFTILFPIK